MVKISAVIITKNEERNIVRCLQSLQGVADEIVVVDSFSADKTKEICLAHGVLFFEQEWLGYGQQKNWGNGKASYDYILSLDADEVLSPKLQRSILLIKENEKIYDGYEFNRLTVYCGEKPIKHCGWYPDNKIRLWNKARGEWSTPLVHETVKMKEGAAVAHLKGDMLHYTYATIDEHMQVANKYTTLVAEEYYKRGKKPTFIKLYISPGFTFFRDYIIKLGFLDGSYGYTICMIAAFSTYLKYTKLRQIIKTRK